MNMLDSDTTTMSRDNRPAGLTALKRKPESTARTAGEDELNLGVYRNLFEIGPHGVVLVDGKGRIIEGNKAAREMFGIRHSLAGSALRELLTPSQSRQLLDLFAMASDGQQVCCVEVEGAKGPLSAQVYVSALDIPDMGGRLYRLFFEDMSDRRHLEKTLRQKQEQVEEMQITLRNVMRSARQEKEELEKDLSHYIKVDILPALRKMSFENSPDVRKNYEEVIGEQLDGLAKGGEEEPDPRFFELTPTELKVCEYIKVGHATKEIAETMHLAFETVQTHRKNIRRKLGLKGRKVSLYMFLRSRGRMA